MTRKMSHSLGAVARIVLAVPLCTLWAGFALSILGFIAVSWYGAVRLSLVLLS
jgi:hypothetical protein